MRLRWTNPALRDIETISDHIATDIPVAADRIVARIFAEAAQLATHPHLGRPGRAPGTRELVVTETSSVVPYRVRGDIVELLAVFHGARLWPERFD